MEILLIVGTALRTSRPAVGTIPTWIPAASLPGSQAFGLKASPSRVIVISDDSDDAEPKSSCFSRTADHRTTSRGPLALSEAPVTTTSDVPDDVTPDASVAPSFFEYDDSLYGDSGDIQDTSDFPAPPEVPVHRLRKMKPLVKMIANPSTDVTESCKPLATKGRLAARHPEAGPLFSSEKARTGALGPMVTSVVTFDKKTSRLITTKRRAEGTERNAPVLANRLELLPDQTDGRHERGINDADPNIPVSNEHLLPILLRKYI